MKTIYCTHYACRLAHSRKEGEKRAAKQRETHAGKSPCVLEQLHDPEVLRKKIELNRLYGKFICD